MRHAFAVTWAVALLVLAGCAGSTAPPSSPADGSAAPTSEPTLPTETPTEPAPPSPTPPATLPPGVSGVFELDFPPSGIVADDRLIWAEDHSQTNKVYALDPETGERVADIPIGRPCDVVAAFDRVWVADLDAGRLAWIDPGTLKVGGEVTGLKRPCGLQATDGALWMAVDEGLARVDPSTGQIALVNLEAPAFPGPGSPVWVVPDGGDSLVRIDADSAKALQTLTSPEGSAIGTVIAPGFGSVWVGGPFDHVYRLDPETGTVQAKIEAAPAARLLVTEDGVWLTSYDAGVVERIDPATNEVVYRGDLGGNINGITEGFGAIWVADTGNGRLYRVDPDATGVAP